MTAQEVDQAARELHGLRGQTLEDSGLAIVAFGLALTASWLKPSLAMPLTIGAFAMAFLAVRAHIRRFFLVEDLAADRDAYLIPAVQEFGLRAASIDHRRQIAHAVRGALLGSTGETGERLAAVRPELEQLIAALEDESAHWDPLTAVALDHWIADFDGSFRDVSAPAAEIRCRVRSILTRLDSDQ
jgi:hypothetical protein